MPISKRCSQLRPVYVNSADSKLARCGAFDVTVCAIPRDGPEVTTAWRSSADLMRTPSRRSRICKRTSPNLLVQRKVGDAALPTDSTALRSQTSSARGAFRAVPIVY